MNCVELFPFDKAILYVPLRRRSFARSGVSSMLVRSISVQSRSQRGTDDLIRTLDNQRTSVN